MVSASREHPTVNTPKSSSENDLSVLSSSKSSDAHAQPFDDTATKNLLRKLDLHVMPILMILYL